MPPSIDDLLREARGGLSRLTPGDALRECQRGALLIDIRPHEQRSRDGLLPGAVVVDRNVFEWRLDPTSEHRLPIVRNYGQRIIVICNQGYASSLAAATLQRLGLSNATDVVGGFERWEADGSPVIPYDALPPR